jgi:hypothetical protein
MAKSALEVAQQSLAYQQAKAEMERLEAIAMEQTAFKRAMEGAVSMHVISHRPVEQYSATMYIALLNEATDSAVLYAWCLAHMLRCVPCACSIQEHR